MTAMTAFIIGLVLGGIAGIVVMAVLYFARQDCE